MHCLLSTCYVLLVLVPFEESPHFAAFGNCKASRASLAILSLAFAFSAVRFCFTSRLLACYVGHGLVVALVLVLGNGCRYVQNFSHRGTVECLPDFDLQLFASDDVCIRILRILRSKVSPWVTW